MSTVVLGLDLGGIRYKHRAAKWRQVCSYRHRDVVYRRGNVDVVRYEIPAKNEATKEKSIIWLSDLHFWGDFDADDEVILHASTLLNELEPDYIVFGGDLVVYFTAMLKAKAFFKSLPAQSEKLAILGNWEYSKIWFPENAWRKFFSSVGFKLLVNSEFEDDSIFFYGVDDLRRGKPSAPEVTPDSKDVVFLAHSPDAYIDISNNKVLEHTDLVLSGHTHGGQIRLPFIGALLTSSRYFLKFDYGHFSNVQSKSNLIVSSGLGCSSIPVRFNCQRELVLIDFV